MSHRISAIVPALGILPAALLGVPLLLGLGACSGGTSTSRVSPPACGDASAFCITECNLGCTAGGCSITDIAPNQPLIFVFSQDVDPRTVDFASFSIKTPAGEEPVGDFFVSGSQINFLPEVRSVQGATFFGFSQGQEYIVTIPAGAGNPNALTATTGDRLLQPFSCTVRISRPVVDLDQRPPEADLITPSGSQVNSAPRNTPVVLEFSEIIDAAPFFGVPLEEGPIRFRIRRSAVVNGQRVCNTSSRQFALGGTIRLENDSVRNVTIASYQPLQLLPAGSCLEVEVTTQVRDLAGTRAAPQIFRILIEETNAVERGSVFTFDNDLEQDRERSAGDWTGGNASFVAMGGSGRHGDFLLDDGATDPGVPDTFVFSTDDQIMVQRPSGFVNSTIRITDGVFEFAKMEIPTGVTVNFIGANPARIHVRGECRIDGRLAVNGQSIAGNHDAKNSDLTGGVFTNGPGQAGGIGGAGGGDGGDGAWACDGNGNPNQPQFNDFNGFDGEDLVLPAGHAYAGQEVGTGGTGATLFPPSGNRTDIVYRGFGNNYSIVSSSAGGGGGYRGAGSAGRVVSGAFITGGTPSQPNEYSGPAAGGVSFPILTIPGGVVTSEYFLVGGAGGGGGASHPLFVQASSFSDPYKFLSGAAGSGAGGAMLLRVGRGLLVGPAGALEARGGAGSPVASNSTVTSFGVPSPGGGGSGGSLVVQVSGDLVQQGSINTSGGAGGSATFNGPFYFSNIVGGTGADGMYRVETPDGGPTTGEIGTALPAPVGENVGALQEFDRLSGFQSSLRVVPEVFAPVYLRYEIDALVDGNPMKFSDDPAVGTPALENSGSALVFFVQGIDIDLTTGEPDPDRDPYQWRRYVGDFGLSQNQPGLNSDATLGFQFILLRDSTVSTDVVVQELRVIYQS